MSNSLGSVRCPSSLPSTEYIVKLRLYHQTIVMSCLWKVFFPPLRRKKPSANSPQHRIATRNRKDSNTRDGVPQNESLYTNSDTNNATISSDSYRSTLPFLVGVQNGEDEISLLTFSGSLCSKETKASCDGQMWLQRNISFDEWEMSQLSYDSDSDTKYTRASI